MDNKRPDGVIDTIANTELMSSALQFLAVEDRFSFISIGKDRDFKVDTKRLYRKAYTIFGCNSLEREVEEVGGWLGSLAPMFERGNLQGVLEKGLTILPVDDALAVYESGGERACGKLVIDLPN